MTILEKITFILFVGIVIFIWNKYAVRGLINKAVEKNSGNKWLADKQNIITKGFEGFYWVFYVMFIVAILSSE